MPYRWLPIALETMRGIEAYEVHQALASPLRWPRLAYGDVGGPMLTIWARTNAGRGLIVLIRPDGPGDWDIVGARAMRTDEAEAFDKWEATR